MLFGVLVCWQAYVVFAATDHGAVLRTFLSGLSAKPPFLTRAYLSTVRFWPVVPALSLLLAADVLRRPAPRIRHSTLVLLVVAMAGFVLQAWATEAWFAPMLELMRKIG